MANRNMLRKSGCALLLLICALGSWTLHAQVVITSLIVGNVDDPQQACIPGALVALMKSVLDVGDDVLAGV